ncbi:MAG: MerR family DNA-binding protein [Acidobacteria bacterium]|nr:MerR family DNA-binding protein [Acidobacteriota bacterium]
MRLRFITKAKGLGLRLAEIREILSLHDRGESPCDRVLNLTKEKINWVDEQIRALQLFRADLQQLWHEAQESRAQTRDCVCSLIEDHSIAQEAAYPRQKLN